ncbi:SDR family NAD(P)-dependent oxidoreductase [Streptomyces sp. NPDC056452]|uniref:SDR family NAD(P)-dependent oxidoreductase n=1 Tax=Streptomyces sp. NPDC056452 TaxID=3345821 RepID=UPI0036BEEA04
MTDDTTYESAVAVIGMAGRFPGAADVDELWRNLLAGVPGLRDLTEEELTAAGVEPEALADPRYVRVGGPVDGVDRFDASLFGLNPREAETMDPQHRLFLECSWEALERSGYPPVDPAAQVGVFAGCGFPDYMLDNVGHLTKEPGGSMVLAVGNERDSLATFVSYKLGLRGPSLTVQTFCSTSLVSVHLAAQSLLTYECDLALAGGVSLPLPQTTGYLYEPGGILSPDGVVRSFDEDAAGTVMGSAAGVVVLKRMTDAIADGDLVHAVILGTAVNNDGRERVGYTAPGVDGQARVVETALAVAGVKPESIGYVECHATGTHLGDSIELAAMSRVFGADTDATCVLGSLKPSVGHLDRAAGVAGLMRAALSLREGVLPGTPGYRTPNPALAAAGNRFTVLPENRPWPEGPAPRRAGVSSFGLGGTNAHVVLEQAPAREDRPASPGPHLLTFSAASPDALDALTDRLRQHIADHPEEDLADVAFTLQVSRGHLALRRALICRDHADAVAALGDPGRWIDGSVRSRDPRLRIAVPDDVPEPWWSRLALAVSGLLPPVTDSRPPAATDRAAALAALDETVTRLGGRVEFTAGGDAAGAASADLTAGPAARPAEEFALAVVAALWEAGAVIDWPALHRGRGRRVELPAYPFRRRRYWVNPSSGQQDAEGRVDDTARWTYRPVWRQRQVGGDTEPDAALRAAGPWLLCVAEERGERLVERLVRAGADVVAVRPGDGFAEEDNGDFTARPGHPGDLAEVLRAHMVAPRTLVHGYSLAAADGRGTAHFEAEQDRGFHSALALVRALAENPLPGPADLVLLTSGATGVVGADLVHPEHASLAALAPSLAQENQGLSCRHVDLDRDAGPADIEQVLASVVGPHEGPVAVRGGEAWGRHYEPCPLPAPEAERPLVGPEETVLITGGLGAVGLTLARHLTAAHGCRLVLTGRGGLPPRERWQEHLAADASGRTARQIRAVLDLEEQGAEVLVMAADVTDEDRMREVVRTAVARFGGIDVVVHGSGAQDPAFFGLSSTSDRSVCDAHFRAKVHGFHVLQSVLGEQAADRRITLSSIAAVLGGITFGPYAAANAALDAYARAARLAGEGRWTTVDWDTWSAERGTGQPGAPGTYGMSPGEGAEVFERILAAGSRHAQIVVSTGPLEPRLRQWVTGGPDEGTPVADDGERHPRPELATSYAAPESELETTLADVWSATLRLDRVGRNDNFFELGGHSLIAIQVATRMSAALAIQLPVPALLAYPTVRELAELIEREGGQSPAR